MTLTQITITLIVKSLWWIIPGAAAWIYGIINENILGN